MAALGDAVDDFLNPAVEDQEELELLQHDMSLSLLQSDLHHVSALLGQLEVVFALDEDALAHALSLDPSDAHSHPPEVEPVDIPSDEEGEAFGEDDSFDVYDDVPVQILRQRKFGDDLYYWVQWRLCGQSWVAAEDFAYPGLVDQFLLRRIKGRPGGLSPSSPDSRIETYPKRAPRPAHPPPPSQWGHGHYLDFRWPAREECLRWVLTTGFDPRCIVTRVEEWVNAARRVQFEAAAQLGGRTVLAFHGTSEANLKSIHRDGLLAGGSGGVPIRHGSAYGSGIYTSKTPSTALSYSDGKVIACALRIPVENPQASVHEFGNIMVIKHPALLLPVYLIHFQLAPAAPLVEPAALAVPNPNPTARQLKRQQYLQDYARRRKR